MGSFQSEYRSLIGTIGYCAITVRFDIAYAVSVLSRYLAKPCKKVVLAAKRGKLSNDATESRGLDKLSQSGTSVLEEWSTADSDFQ